MLLVRCECLLDGADEHVEALVGFEAGALEVALRRAQLLLKSQGVAAFVPAPPGGEGSDHGQWMRAGDALAGVRRRVPGTRSGDAALETLRVAAHERRSVWIGFVDGHGVAGEQVLEPTSVGGGVVEGRDSVDGGLHRVPLHRITSIALVEE